MQSQAIDFSFLYNCKWDYFIGAQISSWFFLALWSFMKYLDYWKTNIKNQVGNQKDLAKSYLI